MKKITGSFIASSILLAGISNVALADTTSKTIQPTSAINSTSVSSSENLVFNDPSKLGENQLQISPNDILTFESKQQKEAYLNLQNSKSNIYSASKVIDGIPSPLVSSEKYTNIFSGYLTGSWVKTDGYTLTSGKSYSLNVDHEGISFGYTYTVDASYKVAADKSRNSRLASYSDFKVNKYKVVHPKVGTYYHTEKDVTATYIKPKYQ